MSEPKGPCTICVGCMPEGETCAACGYTDLPEKPKWDGVDRGFFPNPYGDTLRRKKVESDE